jgi:hypothetical protein
MPAINITDLNNAKLDVDFITAVATSTAQTATDRYGNAKPTVQAAVDSLKAFNSRGAWAPATLYALKDLVTSGGTWYVCVAAHMSSADFATDSAAKWRLHQGTTNADLAAGAVDMFAVGTPVPGVTAKFQVTELIGEHGHYAYLDNSTISYLTPGFLGHASFNCNVKVTSTQDADHHHGYQDYTQLQMAGNIGRFSAFWSQLSHTGSGTVNEASLFKANNPLGTGPITTLYGCYVDGLTRGTENYAIYTSGTTKSLFGGKIQLGQRGATAEIGYNLNGNLDITPRLTYHTSVTAGSLLIGVAAPAAAEALNVTGSSASYITRLYNAGATPRGLAIVYPGAAPNSTDAEFLYCQDSAAVRMKVQSNGNLVNLNNSYGALSDRKLKDRIVKTKPKLSKLMLVRIVDYVLKSDPGTKLIGVIADELEKVFPSMVEETPDYADFEIEPAAKKTVLRQKIEKREHVRIEPKLVNGRWQGMPVSTMVDVPVFETHELFDEHGDPLMEMVERERQQGVGKNGEIIPFKAAVYRRMTHQEPVMEAVWELVPAKVERRATGTFTKSVKYSVFVPMLISAMQEQQVSIDDLHAKYSALSGQ